MLNIYGSNDRNAIFQQFQNILITFFVLGTLDICVCKLINDRDCRLAIDDGL